MYLENIFEASRTLLPLQKGSHASLRGGYAALIAVMKPMDFLKLTTENDTDLNKILNIVTHSVDQYNVKTDNHPNKFEYNMPYLNVCWPSGQVTGHEGRHRAAMVLKSGGISFPVSIYLNSEPIYTVTWKQIDNEGNIEEDDDGDIIYQKQFTSYNDAKNFQSMQQKLNDTFYVRLRTEQSSLLKGHPDRNNFDVHPWVRGAWEKENMPKSLIGQFNETIVIPTSSMKIGVVKQKSKRF